MTKQEFKNLKVGNKVMFTNSYIDLTTFETGDVATVVQSVDRDGVIKLEDRMTSYSAYVNVDNAHFLTKMS